jgi:hypothetical protein
LQSNKREIGILSQIVPENPFAKEPVTFYTDSKLIERAVTSSRFKMVEDIESAEILWVNEPLVNNF